MTNTEIYKQILCQMFEVPAKENKAHIAYEIIGFQVVFDPDGHIEGSSESYIKHELEWYQSQDLYIKGHPGIENNKVWKYCATEDGHVNSNYGWCVFSKDNHEQFNHVIDAIVDDNNTKQAVIYYTRPTIHEQWNDGVHASYDMICTCYVSYLLREGKVNACVHMRSNDVWYGLRNDLAWQQWVLKLVVEELNYKGVKCTAGKIIWNADSLHLYSRNVDEAKEWFSK